MYTLSNVDIAAARTETEAFLKAAKIDSKEILRLGLILEEVLLDYRDKFGDDLEFELRTSRVLGKTRILIRMPCDSFDPFENTEVGELEMLRRLTCSSDSNTSWSYKNGVNNICMTPKRKKKLSSSMLTVIAALIALVAGLICSRLGETIRTGILEEFVVPTLNMLMGVISAVSGPMIFFSLLWGICTIGDTDTLSKIGKKMILRFMLQLLLIAAFSALFCYPFFRGAASSSMAFGLSEFYKMLLGIIPNNMLTPFTTGNTQQIIFMAIILGIVLLVLGSRVSSVTTLVGHTNVTVQEIMKLANLLIPVIVFLSILKVVLSGQLSVISQAYKILLVYLGLSLVILLIYTFIVVLRQKVSPLTLWKKAAPAFLLALTTASSPAVLSTNLDTCENGYGIDKRIVRFGVPLGQTLFKPGSLSRFVAVSFFMAEFYGVAITPNWLAVVIVTCFLMGVSSPPVAGGAVICFSVLFAQLGIPEEAIGFALALNVLFDFVLTSVNIYSLQMELIGLSGKLNMLDRETLRRTSE